MINKKIKFELKKNRFLLKTNSLNEKLSADLKSAINFESNYKPHYI